MLSFPTILTVITVIIAASVIQGNTNYTGDNKYTAAAREGLRLTQTGKCYGRPDHPRVLADRIENYARKSAQTSLCYENLKYSELKVLLQKESYATSHAILSGIHCPLWTERRECLLIHVRRSCTKVERNWVEESLHVNVPVVLSELLCPSHGNYSLLNLLKEVDESGFWDCVRENETFARTYDNCRFYTIGFDIHQFPNFSRYVREMLQCISPAVEACAKGNAEKATGMFRILHEINKVLQETQVDIWSKSDQEKQQDIFFAG